MDKGLSEEDKNKVSDIVDRIDVTGLGYITSRELRNFLEGY